MLSELGTGEVLVSLLDDEGVPTMVQRAYVMPPRAIWVWPTTACAPVDLSSPLYSKYAVAIDRESAYEKLSAKVQQDVAVAAAQAQADAEAAELKKEMRGTSTRKEPPTVVDKLISKTMTRMENKVTDTIVRGIFNQMKKWL